MLSRHLVIAKTWYNSRSVKVAGDTKTVFHTVMQITNNPVDIA